MDTALIYASFKPIAPVKLMKYLIYSRPVAVKSTNHEDRTVTQVDNIVERPMRSRVAKIVENPAMLQVPALAHAPAKEDQVVETHTHLMRRRLATVARGVFDVIKDLLFTRLAGN